MGVILIKILLSAVVFIGLLGFLSDVIDFLGE